MIADNRPGNQLRKHGDIKTAIEQPLLGRGNTTIDINKIGDGLKGKKRNTGRQIDGSRLPGFCPGKDKNRSQSINGEMQVFENKKRQQVDKNPKRKQHLLPGTGTLFKTAAYIKSRQNGGEQQQKINTFTPEVKEQAGSKKNVVTILFPGKKCPCKNERQKQKEKGHRAENHNTSNR